MGKPQAYAHIQRLIPASEQRQADSVTNHAGLGYRITSSSRKRSMKPMCTICAGLSQQIALPDDTTQTTLCAYCAICMFTPQAPHTSCRMNAYAYSLVNVQSSRAHSSPCCDFYTRLRPCRQQDSCTLVLLCGGIEANTHFQPLFALFQFRQLIAPTVDVVGKCHCSL